MPLRKRKRKWLLAAVGVLAAVILLLVGLPLWLPLVARPIFRKFGARYSSYERLSYTRLALHDLDFTNRTVHFHAGRAQTLQPLSWLWRARLSRRERPISFVELDDWSLQLNPQTNKQSAAAESSVYTQS